MTSRSHRTQPSDKSRQRRSGSRTALMVAGVVIAIVMTSAAWTFGSNDSISPEAEPNVPSSEKAASPPADSMQLPAAANRLKGYWVRPDGGYIIKINSIESNGRMDARYYNPRPIHVSQATVSNAGGVAKVFIELRDTNYPGATYTLLYKAKEDLLAGSYYQPALGQTFDVIFTRHMPPQ